MKKTLCRLKTITSLITALIMCIIISDVTVSYADGGPDLAIETLELDINDIPEDRYVTLKVSIDNNPGIFDIIYNIQFDPRLSSDLSSLFPDATSHAVNWGGYIYDESAKKANLHATFSITQEYYENETIMSLGFYLPESCSPGDFYNINFISGGESDGTEPTSYTRPYEICSGFENFGTVTSGGIKITGTSAPAKEPVRQDPEPAPEPEPQPDPTTAPPSVNTAATVTEASSTAVSSAAASSVTGTDITSTAIVTTSASCITTVTEIPETSVLTSHETEITTVSVSGIDTQKDNNSKIHKSIIPAVLLFAALISAFSFVMITKNRSKNKNHY